MHKHWVECSVQFSPLRNEFWTKLMKKKWRTSLKKHLKNTNTYVDIVKEDRTMNWSKKISMNLLTKYQQLKKKLFCCFPKLSDRFFSIMYPLSQSHFEEWNFSRKPTKKYEILHKRLVFIFFIQILFVNYLKIKSQ